jgi:ATP-dependent helicase/nuclease subunit B
MSDACGKADVVRLTPGPDFLDRVAQQILHTCRERLPDLSGATLIVPVLTLAPRLRAALARAARRALLLPRITTLAGLAEPFMASDTRPDAARLVDLYQELGRRGWFDELSRWEICAELIGLFDALTRASLTLPQSQEEFIAELERAYRLHGSAPLRFEARVVHELWWAEAQGRPGRAAALALALAAIAAAADQPLFAIDDGRWTPAEQAFIAAWARRAPVRVFEVQRQDDAADAPTLQFLQAAWPPLADDDTAPPIRDRAVALRERCAASPVAGHLRLLAADSLEEEAVGVALLVRDWLARGKGEIALIAADRSAARRTRALLERDGILVEDETGWKLSTTRAAALIDAWLEVVAAGAYHRDLLDLLKSPFVFADVELQTRRRAVLEIESCVAADNLIGGLESCAASLARRGASAAARELIERLRAAAGLLPRRKAPLAQWLAGLGDTLERIGAPPLLAADAAGRGVLELLALRREELTVAALTLSFSEWRQWLNRELESAMFRDRSIASPVTMTHLSAARLRPFDAAVIIGADSEHLRPAPASAIFNNASVRAELGLDTPREALRRHEDDLALLIASCGEVAATWQRLREGEDNLLSPSLARLSLLHLSAWGGDLLAAIPRAPDATAAGPSPHPAPAPVLPSGRRPAAISASGYASLVACPYQYFARQVLALGEQEEVIEALEKRDYGDLLHRILRRFHEDCPLLDDYGDEDLVAKLRAISDREFAAAVERNFLEAAWQLRWQQRIPAYVAWQRAREAEGWRYAEGEIKVETLLLLADGGRLRVHGRIDRLDRDEAGRAADVRLAVLDYKTQSHRRLKDKLLDTDGDVQLALYTLLQGAGVAQAAYVALDDEQIEALPLEGAQSQALRHRHRLMALFDDLGAGAPLPANGVDAVCAWCEMRGLCRKGYWRQ